jgi:hypothetical protein
MNIKPNVENFALHLKTKCTDKEIHDLVGSIYADEDAMREWNLSVDDYFTAIEIVYFAPQEISSSIH